MLGRPDRRTPYDKLKALFLQTEEADDDESEEKPKRRAKKDDDEPEEKPKRKSKVQSGVSVGDDVWYHGKKCEVVHVSGDGTSLVLEDEDEVIHKAVGHDDLEAPPKKSKSEKPKDDDDDWDDDDEPEKKSKPKSKPKDDDDDWDDDEPPKKSKPKKKAADDDDWDNW